jgi:hypothetical protein
MTHDVEGLDSAFQESVLRLMRHLPSQHDLTLIVLKGHLLVEQELYRIVKTRLQKPDAIRQAKLSFSKLSRLVEGVLGAEAPVWIWRSVDALNRLRNEMVHELEPAKLEELARSFITALDDFSLPAWDGAQLAADLHERVKGGIAYLCGVLMRFRTPDDCRYPG